MRKIDLVRKPWKLNKEISNVQVAKAIIILRSLHARLYEGLDHGGIKNWPFLFHPGPLLYMVDGVQMGLDYITMCTTGSLSAKGALEISYEELIYNLQLMVNEGRRFDK